MSRSREDQERKKQKFKSIIEDLARLCEIHNVTLEYDSYNSAVAIYDIDTPLGLGCYIGNFTEISKDQYEQRNRKINKISKKKGKK